MSDNDVIILLQKIDAEVVLIKEDLRIRDVLIRNAIEGIDARTTRLERTIIQHTEDIKKLKNDDIDIKKDQSDHDWKIEADQAAQIMHLNKFEKGVMSMALEFKKDPMVIGPAVIVLGGIGFLYWFGKIDWPGAIALIGLLGLPSVFGRKKK